MTDQADVLDGSAKPRRLPRWAARIIVIGSPLVVILAIFGHTLFSSTVLFGVLFWGIVIAAAVVYNRSDYAKNAKKRSLDADAQLVCPHCQTRGKVSTQRAKVKQGVSGGKATGAVLTGGLSLLATGLSRKQMMTKAKCGNCRSEWLF